MDLAKREHDEEQEAFLPPSRACEDDSSSDKGGSRKARWPWRLVLEIVMAVVIAVQPVLLMRAQPDGRLKPSPVPKLPRKMYKFVENPRYLHENMFATEKETLHTLHNWIELSADGRGYITVERPGSFDLGEPYTVQMRHSNSSIPAYMVSVFHQLHCLSYLVQHYQTELTQEVAHHSAHCFDYIRQSIMCAADTSLEGKTDAGPGWGSEHECTDYDALLEWANKHTAVAWRNRLLPDEAVL